MIQLDYNDPRPLYEQIKDSIRRLVMKQVLKPHDQIPSVRDLASGLTVNPNTIQKALRDLEGEGYIYSIRGKGNYVAELNEQLKVQQERQLFQKLDALVEEMADAGIDPGKIYQRIETSVLESFRHKKEDNL